MAAFDQVLITGASSGIGRALALGCARPGVILHLGGRHAARLAEVARACEARGATVHERLLDVRDAGAMAAWVGGVGRLDLVIANSGISAGTGEGALESAAQTRAIFATNLDGMLNTVLPALEAMARQPADAAGVRGRIAAVASVAAFIPVPGSPSYCASKAAVDAWMVAMAPVAWRTGVVLTSVCPGYIRTPMTQGNRYPMPGLMAADRAAAIILRGIAAGRRRVAFPWWMAVLARTAALLPPRFTGALLGRAPGKATLAPRP